MFDFAALGCSPSVEIWQWVLELEDYFFSFKIFAEGMLQLFFFFDFLGLDVLKKLMDDNFSTLLFQNISIFRKISECSLEW